MKAMQARMLSSSNYVWIFFSFLVASSANAATLLIWPVHIVYAPGQRTAELWLENRSEDKVSMQIRVLEWSQKDGAEEYAPQQMLLASPPFGTIEGGKKQLIRLVRPGPPDPSKEYHFRVLIDEIPRKDEINQSGVQFQMRYSVPVFFQHGTPVKEPAVYFAEHLSCKIADGKLVITNTGEYSARIARLSLSDKNNERKYLTQGLLGYVLPGSTMSWAIDKTTDLSKGFYAEVNGEEVHLALRGAQ